MDIRQSVFGEIATYSETPLTVYGIDLGTLLHRLLLFDSVVIRSYGLQEIPFLIRALRKEGFLQLLDTGVLKLSCEFTGLIIEMARNGVRSVPPNHFTFGTADLPNRDEILRRGLKCLQGVSGLSNADRVSIEDVILTRLARPPAEYGAQLQAQVESDLRSNCPALRMLILEQLKKQGADNYDQLNIQVEETGERIFHLVNNLPKIYGITEERAHEILKPAVMALGNLNQRIANMQAYSAITGFTEADASLLFGKLAGLLAAQNPAPMEEQFARVIKITNLGDFTPGKRVDIGKLMEVRESVECREFRHWLSDVDSLTDREIEEIVGGVRNKISSMIQSSAGKIWRFAATTATGLIPGVGVAAGPVVAALDAFLIDNVFTCSAVVAFLREKYPSLFVSA